MGRARASRTRLVGAAASALVGALVVSLGPAALPGAAPPATAAEPQDHLVSLDPADHTPDLVPSTAFANPHVNALAELGDTVFAGGSFDTVRHDGRTYQRRRLVAFDRDTGAVRTGFAPDLGGGPVWALATDPATGSVYVGGRFRTVDGVARAAVAKLDAATGRLDPAFDPVFTGGQINDLEVLRRGGATHLIAGGTPGRKLMSLDPATGLDDRYLTFRFTEKLPDSWGGVAPYQLAVDPTGRHLAVTGNFLRVDGQPRDKFVMIDLGDDGATLSDWYYPGFAKPCSSTQPRRIPYLQGVDWSPDGTSFSVAATGQIPLEDEDVWYARLGADNAPNTTVCDGVGRFSLADDTRPEWINYTGGDSVWSVADTGAGVYVAGHFKWVDNPDGWGSRDVGDQAAGTPATSRLGIAALDPDTGLALDWNPGLVDANIGGKAFLADDTGLWIGNDSTAYGNEEHRGLVFAPVTAPQPPSPDKVVWAVGEACGDESDPRQAACADVARLIAGDPETDAVLGLGDLQGPAGTLEAYQDSYDALLGTGPGLKAITHPVPGEADYRVEGAADYFDFFGAAAGQAGEGWYAVDLGGWRLIGINSFCSKVGGCGGNQPQGAFLGSSLGDLGTRCELVFDHHPAFSDGARGDHGWGRSVFTVAANNGAELMLSGRDADYQRFPALAADGTPADDGLVQHVVGTGGQPLTGWADGAPRSAFRQNSETGALRLVLGDDGWTSQFVTVDGRVLDTAAGTCRR